MQLLHDNHGLILNNTNHIQPNSKMLGLFASSLTNEASWSILVVLGLCSLFVSYVIFSPRQSFSPHSPKQISDQYPIFGALRFFSERWDFYRDAIAESKTGNFSFYLGKYGVIGFSGRQARKDFFESKILSLHEGYVLTRGWRSSGISS